MTLTRTEINRRAAAARRIVLRRLAKQQPDTYRAWLDEAYISLQQKEVA